MPDKTEAELRFSFIFTVITCVSILGILFLINIHISEKKEPVVEEMQTKRRYETCGHQSNLKKRLKKELIE